MLATVVNALVIMLGGLIGVLFKSKIKTRYTDSLMAGLAVVVIIMGIMNTVDTENIMIVILCIVFGTLLGEWIDIDSRLETLGNFLKKRFTKNKENPTFTEGFVSASLLFCIGPMAITGALEAGINHDYSVLFSKSAIDGVAAISFSAALGTGVIFSALPIFLYQGILTVAAIFVAPYLSTQVVAQMSAVGGIMLIGVGLNMLNLGKKIRVANMLPAMFLPLLLHLILSFLNI